MRRTSEALLAPADARHAAPCGRLAFAARSSGSRAGTAERKPRARALLAGLGTACDHRRMGERALFYRRHGAHIGVAVGYDWSRLVGCRYATEWLVMCDYSLHDVRTRPAEV